MFIKGPSSALSDELLIQQYRQDGDLENLSVLYARYLHLCFGVCLKYFKNEDQSKDAVMQIFEKLIVELQKHDVDNFKSWLYVLARNYCLMELRKDKSKKEKTIPLDVEYESIVHHEEEAPLEDELDKLKICIEKLKEAQKDCVKLFFLDERSYKEIVEVTGFEMKKVKSYIQNAKRNLKICIEGL